MATLDGAGTPVTLGPGVVLTAPGLRGAAQLQPARPAGGRGREPEPATRVLEECLARAGMVQSHAVEIRAQQVGFTGVRVGTTGARDVRSADGRSGISLEVPDLGPQRGQVLLLADEAGVLSWHYPERSAQPSDSAAPAARAARGGGSLRFVVPREVAATTSAGGVERRPGERSLITVVGKKVLSVLVYPIIDTLVGKAALFLAERWEREHRPYRARAFGPEAYREPAAEPLDDVAWGRLAEGRTLLFLHGTFSTSHGSFGALGQDTMAALDAAYGHRLLAFDHPSLSTDPVSNARALVERIPRGLSLEMDVVSHSRGGLVARALAGEVGALTSSLSIGRLVFVGVPNIGTPLADPKHMGEFVDRITALLNLLPPGPWTVVADVLDSILEVVKILAQGAMGGLPGLAAMDPKGEFLTELNMPGVGGQARYAVDANFEPTGSLASLWRLPDTVVDKVFEDRLNDAIVPTDGVWQAGNDPGFPVPADRRLHFDSTRGVWHCSYFAQPDLAKALVGWLPG